VTHDIPHDLSPELAQLAARKAVEAYGERFAKFSFSSRWVKDDHVEIHFSVKGVNLDGTMRVLPSKMTLDLEVPFLFRIFRGKAVEIIDREARTWIDRARRGELVPTAD
jgi:hypothetical protein